MERTAVKSSNIVSIGYADGILEIEFAGGHGRGRGRIYQYRDVPPALVNEFLHAESIGRFFREHIVPAFIGERVMPPCPVAETPTIETKDWLAKHRGHELSVKEIAHPERTIVALACALCHASHGTFKDVYEREVAALNAAE